MSVFKVLFLISGGLGCGESGLFWCNEPVIVEEF
jgi:hypothetical protein